MKGLNWNAGQIHMGDDLAYGILGLSVSQVVCALLAKSLTQMCLLIRCWCEVVAAFISLTMRLAKWHSEFESRVSV